MPDLSPRAKAAMRYWQTIETGAANNLPTADIWALIHEQAEEEGLASPGVTVQGVNELRAIASRIYASANRLERAREQVSITDRMAAEAPWARPLEQQAALGLYQVRYRHTTITAEGPQTNWRTSIFHGQLPGTVAELRAAISEDAQQLADKYGVSHVDFGNLQILSV